MDIENGSELCPLELINLQIDAGHTYDQNRRLLTVNEPWDGTVPSPRFVLGRTIDGKTVRRYRHDVSGTLVEKLEFLASGEIPAVDFKEKPEYFDNYLKLLDGQNFSMGPDFLILPGTGSDAGNGTGLPAKLVGINGKSIGDYSCEGFEWLVEEIDLVQPCVALVYEGRIVSQCRSVRISSRVHEAGLETLEAFRGRGYASLVTAGWARAVRETGALPVYSTSWKNTASQRVALKMGLWFYGNTFSVS